MPFLSNQNALSHPTLFSDSVKIPYVKCAFNISPDRKCYGKVSYYKIIPLSLLIKERALMAKINKSQLIKLQGKYVTDDAIGKLYGISRQAVHRLRINSVSLR